MRFRLQSLSNLVAVKPQMCQKDVMKQKKVMSQTMMQHLTTNTRHLTTNTRRSSFQHPAVGVEERDLCSNAEDRDLGSTQIVMHQGMVRIRQ
mmetsp:Transcript_20169/g.41098  ORF Transcript_20169/g.41098 Transcript_20169/m.41098 type:complete len:92 (-) Transcript_20169:51-326(-)